MTTQQPVYGIDFGASNSAVCVLVENQVVSLPIDHDDTVIATLLSYYADLHYLVGSQAHAIMLQGQDEVRFIRNIKTALSLLHIHGTYIFDEYKKFIEIIADYLRHLRQQANAYLGVEVNKAVIGRPVKFHDKLSDSDNRAAQLRLKTAALLAGFDDVSFAYEPVAASIGALQDLTPGKIILTFDFGGSTLDLHLLRSERDQRNRSSFRTLGVAGLRLGGHDITEKIIKKKILRYFGYGVAYKSRNTDSRFNPGGMLEIPNMLPLAVIDGNVNRDDEKILAAIKQIHWEAGTTIPELARLDELLRQRRYYQLYDLIDQAKIKLSQQLTASIQWRHGVIAIEQQLDRREFEQWLQPFGAKTRSACAHLLAQAAVTPDQVDFIVRVGGSSEIPYFVQLLRDYFPQADIIKSDLFLGVAKGLAQIGADPALGQYAVV